ncbi:MAG: hypothetical protein M1830_001587 [Pleopsidium flavum]|nr:MAG: hypothetical protein M1830_001587 [Pleopsidium flavum]
METIATLPRISRERLSSLLLSHPSKLAIIDVRDDGKPPSPTLPTLPRSPPPLLLPNRQANSPKKTKPDYVGGHIKSSTHVPSRNFASSVRALVETLREKEVEGVEIVVFLCALSQQRGPGAAVRFLRARARVEAEAEAEAEGQEGGGGGGGGGGEGDGKVKMGRGRPGQEVVVLEGGFVGWQEK